MRVQLCRITGLRPTLRLMLCQPGCTLYSRAGSPMLDNRSGKLDIRPNQKENTYPWAYALPARCRAGTRDEQYPE